MSMDVALMFHVQDDIELLRFDRQNRETEDIKLNKPAGVRS
jgi:hypothetical protein